MTRSSSVVTQDCDSDDGSRPGIGATDRHHFLAIAARAMRQVIVDHARVRAAARRGAPHVPLDDRDLAVQYQAEHLLAVNDALERLALENPRLLQVVECRFFAGYSEVETAAALAVSARTVECDWLRAKAWLREGIDGDRQTQAGATGGRHAGDTSSRRGERQTRSLRPGRAWRPASGPGFRRWCSHCTGCVLTASRGKALRPHDR